MPLGQMSYSNGILVCVHGLHLVGAKPLVGHSVEVYSFIHLSIRSFILFSFTKEAMNTLAFFRRTQPPQSTPLPSSAS